MESRHTSNMLPRYAEARSICRTFSTHIPRLQAAEPPSTPPPTNTPPTPPPYRFPQYDPATRNQRRQNEFGLVTSLATDASALRQNLDRVNQYDSHKSLSAELEKMGRARDLERQISRKWKAGDVYAPHDLSGVEMQKWRKRRTGGRDVFDLLGINPLGEYKVRFR